jgi:hypothetical protein
LIAETAHVPIPPFSVIRPLFTVAIASSITSPTLSESALGKVVETEAKLLQLVAVATLHHTDLLA